MKVPEKGTTNYDILILHCFDVEVLERVHEGTIIPPEDMLEIAIKTAVKKFKMAQQAEIFEEIIANLADCRQILHDIGANFSDIGVDETMLIEIEEKLHAARAQTKNSVDGHEPDVALRLSVMGNNKLLPS